MQAMDARDSPAALNRLNYAQKSVRCLAEIRLSRPSALEL
jgi:hypothetical protein